MVRGPAALKNEEIRGSVIPPRICPCWRLTVLSC